MTTKENIIRRLNQW